MFALGMSKNWARAETETECNVSFHGKLRNWAFADIGYALGVDTEKTKRKKDTNLFGSNFAQREHNKTKIRTISKYGNSKAKKALNR